MKTLLLFLGLCSTMLSGQELVGRWHISKVMMNKAEETYTLSQVPEDDPRYHYGNLIEFKNDKTFESFLSVPCGNDCVPSSKGTFKVIEKNKIKFVVKEIHRSGMTCENFSKKGSWNLGTYIIEKTEEGLLLKKL